MKRRRKLKTVDCLALRSVSWPSPAYHVKRLNQTSLKLKTSAKTNAADAAIPITKFKESSMSKLSSDIEATVPHRTGRSRSATIEDYTDYTDSAANVVSGSHDYVRDNCRPLCDSQLRIAIRDNLGVD